MPPQACHGVEGGLGEPGLSPGLASLGDRQRESGNQATGCKERLKNGTHAGWVLKAATPSRRPSYRAQVSLPFGGDLQPGAEPGVPAGGEKTCTPETVSREMETRGL